MMAGRMRMRNFLALVAAGVAAVAVCGFTGLLFTGIGGTALLASAPTPVPPSRFELGSDPLLVASASPPAAPIPDMGAAASADPLAARDLDRALIAWQGKALGKEKLQDVSAGQPWKINLYQDAGKGAVNRAKVDLDRDNKDDEKWTFEDDGAIVRKVSPLDDGQSYPLSYRWSGSAWALEGGAAPVPATPPVAAAAVPAAALPSDAREVDQVAFGYQGKNINTDKIKDVTAGRPYKISVYQDAGQATVNRAKIDLDRDDKWDEKITFEGAKITRQVAPGDDESYTQTFHWDGAAWVP